MSLNERLRYADLGSAPPPSQPLSMPPPPSTAGSSTAADPLVRLKHRVQEALLARLGSRLYDSSISEEQLGQHVAQELALVVQTEQAPLSSAERQRLAADVRDDVLGYGPVQRFLDDPLVTEIMVNGCSPIYVEQDGRLHRTTARFLVDDHLRRVIERIVGRVGRRIDESSPMVDARLPDGSRVNAIIPPLAVQGSALTIRKFARTPFSAQDLIRFNTMTPEIVEFLANCVEGKMNILVSGGTGTGKTTLLNVISGSIPETERIVTIEDAVELRLNQDHVVALESRPANIEGRGEVTIRQLVRNALRMRPDRIIVGEVRGPEALDMLQAMNTGHEGSLSTLHANSPRDALARLDTMVLMAGMELPVRAIREQVSSAVDLIVHLGRLRDGSRRITQITEVQGLEGDTIQLQDLFTFDFKAGIGPDGRFLGSQSATGAIPGFANHLADLGIPLRSGSTRELDAVVPQVSSNGQPRP